VKLLGFFAIVEELEIEETVANGIGVHASQFYPS